MTVSKTGAGNIQDDIGHLAVPESMEMLQTQHVADMPKGHSNQLKDFPMAKTWTI